MNPDFLHDLRQPLTAIQNFTRACINELHRHPDGGEKVFGWLESANQQAVRASEMLKEAKAQGQSANCPPVRTDIKRCIENILIELRRESRITAGVLNVKSDEEPYLLLADPALLEAVFRDLLVGAMGSLPRADDTAWVLYIDIGRENADLVLDIGADPPVSDSVGAVSAAGARGRECSALIIGLSTCEAIIECYGGLLTLWRRQEGRLRVWVRLPAYQQPGGAA